MEGMTSLFRTVGPRPTPQGVSSALPSDLLERVRGRVRLLSFLIFLAFSFDLVFFAVEWVTASLAHRPMAAESLSNATFQWVNLGAALASAALWWAAGKQRASPSRLHALGLVYEVVICFVIGIEAVWMYYLVHGLVPNLTWIPTLVVLFPLVMPGPPGRMLLTTILSAAMWPLSILLLDLAGKVNADVSNYAAAIVGGTFAVVFAHMGARIVYGLGREVATAREMGSYQLEERLGQGGMGEVWRARHRMLARPAAIKLIRPALLGDLHAAESDALQSRFAREANAIAGLRSPHTVNLYDFGVADDGTFYLVMELLDGMDADRLVRKFGPVPPERAIHVLQQMCHSLSEADSRGLVHRDIKPANVFLCRYGEEFDFVKVLDFGLVKAFKEADSATPALTRDNIVHGTPAFIPPEQAMGAELDGRADIYATGCVAYWLLTGQQVFTASTPMAVALEHVRATPAPPSSRARQPIPDALDRLVLRCLAKDPDDRPPSAKALARELSQVPGLSAWTQERAREWWGAIEPATEVAELSRTH